MKKLLIGKYVNTHGIKGEIRIKSYLNLEDKAKVFKPNIKVFIENQEFIINTYRHHKDYEMITLKGIDNINQILALKGTNVYVLRDSKELVNEHFLEDLLNFQVICHNKVIGNLQEIKYITVTKKLLVVNNKLIPFELILKVDFKKQIIYIKEVLGLL